MYKPRGTSYDHVGQSVFGTLLIQLYGFVWIGLFGSLSNLEINTVSVITFVGSALAILLCYLFQLL